jgi:hypothetical protein
MEQTLQRILAGVYVLIGLVGVLVIPLVYIILSQLDRGNGMPRVNSFQKSIRLLGGIAKRQFSQVVPRLRKVKNMGEVKPVPDIPLELERRLARAVLDLFQKGADIKLTEAYWLGRWGGSPVQFRALMERWEAERIVERVNPDAANSTRRLARGAIGKLKAK